MNKLQYVCYAFQCGESETFILDSFLYIPFNSSFPDDWAFDEFEIDQKMLDDVLYWVVKI
jgi:hypothetical protein